MQEWGGKRLRKMANTDWRSGILKFFPVPSCPNRASMSVIVGLNSHRPLCQSPESSFFFFVCESNCYVYCFLGKSSKLSISCQIHSFSFSSLCRQPIDGLSECQLSLLPAPFPCRTSHPICSVCNPNTHPPFLFKSQCNSNGYTKSL